jgi:WD40 repeat protein
VAIGTDASPFTVFWTPSIQNSPIFNIPFPNANLHTDTVTGLKFTCNNSLISVSKDVHVKKWNFASATNIWDTSASAALYAVGLLNSGRIVTGSNNGVIRDCDMNGTCPAIGVFIHTSNIINAYEILDNGDLVSGANDGYIKVWAPGSYTTPKYQKNFGVPVKSLKRLPNGYLACGLANGTIVLLDQYNSFQSHLVLESHQNNTNALELLENGDLASGSDDGFIKIWNSSAFLLNQTLNAGFPVNCLKRLPNNRLASGFNYQVVIWNLNDPGI